MTTFGDVAENLLQHVEQVMLVIGAAGVMIGMVAAFCAGFVFFTSKPEEGSEYLSETYEDENSNDPGRGVNKPISIIVDGESVR